MGTRREFRIVERTSADLCPPDAILIDKTGIHRQIDLHRLLDVLAENAS